MTQSQISSVPTERYDVLFERSGEPFRYPPLEPDSARFLNLQPSQTGTDALSCSFLHLPCTGDTEYEVLSGFWGSPSPFQPASLLVDGRSCKTTPKLAQALYRFRLREKPRLLWIQSLCINSFNVGERNSQIGRLRDVLQSAQRLIVWLGAAEYDSDTIFEHLSQFRHLVTEDNWPRPPPVDPGSSYGRHEIPYRPAAPAPKYDYVRPYPKTAEAAFAHLCLRPWFYRPWSIPELALSKNILLVCGNHELQLAPFYNPVAMVVRAHRAGRQQLTTPCPSYFFADLNIPVADAVSQVSSLSFHACSLAWFDDSLTFENAYRIVRTCLANDPRDSVFAIAALEPVSTVNIDYTLSVSEVYQQTTLTLMRKHRSYQVLRRLNSTRRDSDLPSWTLDFSTPLVPNHALWTLPGVRFLHERPPYTNSVEQADANRGTLLWPLDAQTLPQTRIDSGRLFITGLLMEAITAIGPLVPATSNGEADQDTLAAWEQLACQLHPTKKRFPQSVVDAFFDTIMANDTHDVRRNYPPRPPVSPVADRARQWYMRHGAGILQEADPEYFAALSSSSQLAKNVSPYREYDISDIWNHGIHRKKGEGEEDSQEHDLLVAGRRIARACSNRRFFITDRGSMGLAPAHAKEGDVIVFLPTGVFPLFLQPLDHNTNGDNDAKKATYKLLGEGFLYDWWQHIAPVFELRSKTGSYGNFMTDFVIE